MDIIESPCNVPGGKPWPCKFCGVANVYYSSDETHDGAYDVYRYHCHACGSRWRVVDEID